MKISARPLAQNTAWKAKKSSQFIRFVRAALNDHIWIECDMLACNVDTGALLENNHDSMQSENIPITETLPNEAMNVDAVVAMNGKPSPGQNQNVPVINKVVGRSKHDWTW